eukprot:TRINITY_DN4815_c0_g1_i1.p1 TRINITY_DN4815_c0_g1~~TRINITY_DN4815_c0_g1_i1.p1  ORF type:complete len:637 (+),score=222.22 TRINITY_DN4815_c0_g1_i1:130-2040(+)
MGTEEDVLTSAGVKKKPFFKYPTGVYFIFGNELCERFSFYGLRAILYLYLNQYLLFDPDQATSGYHAFVFGAYVFPVLGGILSDSYWGKYKTIIYVTVVYCIGSSILSMTAIPGFPGIEIDGKPHWWGCALGLTLIAVGTGGIKPCVSSFGGDQFAADQAELLSSFFAFFYFSINIGSAVSTFVTPVLREQVPPHGSGYWAAFGLPAVLLVISLAIFLSGKRHYTIVPPNKNNMVWLFVKVVKCGVSERFKSGRTPVGHWLDRAYPYFERQTVDDIKALLRILIVFVPLPVFWALFDQHGSRWIGQAVRMDRSLGGPTITPDQVPMLNPLFVMVLIPLFDYVIYPFCRRMKINLRPLRRMTVGMALTSLSFVLAAFVELALVSAKFSDTPQAQLCNAALPAQQWSLSEPANMTGRLQNKADELCLVGTCSGGDCYPLAMRSCDDNDISQRFRFEPAGMRIVSQANGMCLELLGAAGSEIGVAPCKPNGSPTDSQAWNVSGATIASLAGGGLCVEVVAVADQPLHVAWQIPQFFVLTLGEVLVSVSGLEFSYSQAPESMKSVIMAFWALTVSFGNLLVVGVAEGVAISMLGQYFLFAALMAVFMVVFLLIARSYVYIEDVFKDESIEDRDDVALLGS